MENSINKNNNDFLIDMSDEYKQIKRRNELVKSQDINTNLKKIKNNILESSEINQKILNKRTKLNNLCNSLFSNMEINKYINESKKTSVQKASTYFTKKIENRNNIGIQSVLDDELILSNRISEKDLYNRDKIELKDQSTNTYNNLVSVNNYNCGKLHSFESNKNNIYEKNIFVKTPINKRNNKINLEQKMKTFNKSKNNIINRKSNRLNKISINNNVNFKNESNNNNYKYYLELYKFYLIQSVTQNKAKYFNLKNKNSNGNKIKIPNPLLFLHNTRNNIDENKNCSLRELYRYLNYDKLAVSLYQMSQTKKNKLKKKIKKNDDKKIKKHNNIFDRNNNHRLMNVQYNIDEYFKTKNKENKDFFQKTLFEKKVFNINMKNNENIKNENKSDYHIKKNFIKTSKNFRNNIIKEKFSPIKDSTFDKGITSLSPDIKSYQKVHLTLINKRNNKNNKNTLK